MTVQGSKKCRVYGPACFSGSTPHLQSMACPCSGSDLICTNLGQGPDLSESVQWSTSATLRKELNCSKSGHDQPKPLQSHCSNLLLSSCTRAKKKKKIQYHHIKKIVCKFFPNLLAGE